MKEVNKVIGFTFIVSIAIIAGGLILSVFVRKDGEHVTPQVTRAPRENINENEGVADRTNQNLSGGLKYSLVLNDSENRITKKPFGIKITKTDSPVQPERFSGFHTGIDFEILPGEEEKDVEIRSFCTGNLRMKTTASGYGGVVVQECELDEQAVTVIYGHLRISSVSATVSSQIKAGDVIGFLGTGGSAETDGERKHLHFAIHKGSEINIKGYVQTEEALEDWIDPAEYF